MADFGELSKEALIGLLAKLSREDDVEKQSLAYTRLHGLLTRFFQIKGDAAPESGADVTLDRVARKIAQGEQLQDVTKFSFGVARLVFYERNRAADKIRKAAESSQKEGIVKFVSLDNHGEEDDWKNFRECFRALSRTDREFLQSYFTESANRYNRRQSLAKNLQISITHLRLRIFRLRQRLAECVRHKLNR